jgi:hypothetical protein
MGTVLLLRRRNQFERAVRGGGGGIISLTESPFAEPAVSGEMGLKNVSNLHRKTDPIGAQAKNILNTYASSKRDATTDKTKTTIVMIFILL